MSMCPSNFKKFEIVGFFIVSALAVIFHFLYDWSGGNMVLAFFSPVNESVWEHVKIVVFPFILYAIVELFFLDLDLKKFVFAKTMSLWIMVILMIVFFYTYTGIVGENIMAVDIISTFVYIAIGFIVSYKIMCSYLDPEKYFKFSLIMLLLLLALIFIFTFFPPQIPLFFDTSAGYYGIEG